MKTPPAIYLDYAATTPVDAAVLRAMTPYFSEKFGNAGSLHSFGQDAIAAVDRSREVVARAIGAEFREIVFTGSATEANNFALRGVVGTATRDKRQGTNLPRVIVSAIEHESVLETARDLEKEGVDVVYLPVDKAGIVDLKKLKESLNEDTVLVSVMYVNNEIGTVQPIFEISEIIRNFRETRDKGQGTRLTGSRTSGNLSPVSCRLPLFHSDASQALQFFDCDVNRLGVDLMTLSSHKMYGPKGAAALYVATSQWGIANGGQNFGTRHPIGNWLNPITFGGGQEFGLRSGTENVPAIVGFAKAVQLFPNPKELGNKKIAALRDDLWRGIKKVYKTARINGVEEGRREKGEGRAPHILNVYFPGYDAQDVLTRLDLAGIAASSGSACRSRAMERSYVIEALGFSKTRAKSSIRFSFGRPTTKKEIDTTLKVLKEILR